MFHVKFKFGLQVIVNVNSIFTPFKEENRFVVYIIYLWSRLPERCLNILNLTLQGS